MNTLHLTLKKKWFDMIISGDKKEEYREIKDYWKVRFCAEGINNFLFCDLCPNHDCFNNKNEKSIHFDTITFKNGYAANAPEIVIECKGIEIKQGNPQWGAEVGVLYFVLSLGEILSTKNICTR